MVKNAPLGLINTGYTEYTQLCLFWQIVFIWVGMLLSLRGLQVNRVFFGGFCGLCVYFSLTLLGNEIDLI